MCAHRPHTSHTRTHLLHHTATASVWADRTALSGVPMATQLQCTKFKKISKIGDNVAYSS